ncbi:MAG: N-acetyltransferase family protein [Alphaproteobacteria bacterium]
MTKKAAFKIRKARLEDFEEIYAIFCQILDAGETYSYSRKEMTPERSLGYWISAPGTHCYVADIDKKVVAMAAIRPNRTCHGDHVANASYIVDPAYRGRGIGRALGKHIIKEAKKFGYKAMQYNFVISTNKIAVDLWKSLGFAIVGTLPRGFQHANGKLVDVHIMHRFL